MPAPRTLSQHYTIQIQPALKSLTYNCMRLWRSIYAKAKSEDPVLLREIGPNIILVGGFSILANMHTHTAKSTKKYQLNHHVDYVLCIHVEYTMTEEKIYMYIYSQNIIQNSSYFIS